MIHKTDKDGKEVKIKVGKDKPMKTEHAIAEIKSVVVENGTAKFAIEILFGGNRVEREVGINPMHLNDKEKVASAIEKAINNLEAEAIASEYVGAKVYY